MALHKDCETRMLVRGPTDRVVVLLVATSMRLETNVSSWKRSWGEVVLSGRGMRWMGWPPW